MGTKTKIEFGFVDTTAKDDSSLSASDKQDFVDLNDLKKENLEEIKYGTCEKNQFALDGTFQLMPDNLENMGLWSNQMSNEDGDFITPITMEIDFTEVHSSLGLTFQFSSAGDYCNHLNIKFYDSSNNILSDKDFYPDNYYYVCAVSVEKYKKIVITFYSTNNPYRYLKIYQILYGANKIFDSTMIESAKILEETDILSSELSINTLDFSIYSEDEEFNVINPSGVYKLLQKRQKLTVTIIKDENEKNMGVFYLDDWDNEDDTISNFSAIDLVGVIDKTTFYGGMYKNVIASNLIKEILETANLDADDYYIAEELNNILITGHIDISTCREALQQVLFVVGAIIDTTRDGKIKIYIPSKIETEYEINKNRKEMGSSKPKLNDIITGVEITSYNFEESDEEVELYKSTLEAGTYTIEFSDIAYSISITGGTIIKSNCNYAIIEVMTENEVIITGKKYTTNKNVITVLMEDLTEDEKENNLKVTSAYLVNQSNVQEIATRILNYYSNSYKYEFKFLMENEKIADYIPVDSLYNRQIVGYLTKLNIDLVGGFIANATQIGTLKEV